MTIYESNYRFNDPIRYFTSNDPYYWEIDNIPLKQLMENDLWLKDQLEAGIKITIDEIDRSGFSELKPYSLGVDGRVRVKPGRFSARINDPMVDFRLQEIYQVAGEVFHEDQAWKMATMSTSSLAGSLSSLTAVTDPNNATFMNGLYERAFALETFNTFIPPNLQSPQSRRTNAPGETSINVPGESTNSMLLGRGSISTTGGRVRLDASAGQYIQYLDSRGYRTGDISDPDYIHFSKAIEANFIKFWRGVTRTAIVDVPEELTIDIPEFNVNDFDYVDEQGLRQQRLDAEVRIDLLFIYSKPIDASYVRVRDSSRANNSTPVRNRIITRAELGLVKGAGVILQKNSTQYGYNSSGAASNLGTKIFANVADSLNTSAGFTREQIYGSFPSPDDLMNMTPLLTEQLEAENHLLVGQSVLPIAYVIVRKPTGVSNDVIVRTEDIVDIRPFFRTTELSYNERAGIAAANPPLSIANPVVSRLELKQNNKKIKIYVDDAIANIPAPGGGGGGGTGGGGVVGPRIVGTGYVFGGLKYGPEATIINFAGRRSADVDQKRSTLIDEYGYPEFARDDLLTPDPNWDQADWSLRAGVAPTYAHDYIDVAYTADPTDESNVLSQLDYFCELDRSPAFTGYELAVEAQFLVCVAKKKIYFDDLNISNFQDIHIDLEYVNSVPIMHTGDLQRRPFGLTYSKGVNNFTIFAYWPWGCVFKNRGGYAALQDIGAAWGDMSNSTFSNKLRLETQKSLGHFVSHKLFTERTSNAGTMNGRRSTFGLCVFPTVRFNVIGVPSGYDGILTTPDAGENSPNRLRLT